MEQDILLQILVDLHLHQVRDSLGCRAPSVQSLSATQQDFPSRLLSGRKTLVITPDKSTELGSRTPVCLFGWLVCFVLFAGGFHLILFSARGFLPAISIWQPQIHPMTSAPVGQGQQCALLCPQAPFLGNGTDLFLILITKFSFIYQASVLLR